MCVVHQPEKPLQNTANVLAEKQSSDFRTYMAGDLLSE